METHQTTLPSDMNRLADAAVGELVAERPNRSKVFQRHGIDFCCQGTKTVRQACERRNVDLGVLLQELEAELSVEDDSGENPATLPAAELVDYIVERHHGFLREELPRLMKMADRVAQVHGGHTPSLVEVRDVLTSLAQELTHHLMKEEQVLFPAIVRLAQGEQDGFNLDGPIGQMLVEHQDAGDHLAKLRELTNGYTPPPDACNTYRALFSGLADLETDLHRHIHLENSVLFPAARELTGQGY